MLITLSGVDCCGKSTQLELLRQHFVSCGQSCATLWYRPGYSKELQALKSVVRPIFRRRASKAALGAPLPLAAPPALWIFTAGLDAIVQWGLKLRFLLARYDVVLCDRYIEDAQLDLAFKFPDAFLGESLFKAVARTFPRPTRAFFLRIPLDVAIKRAAAKHEPFPDDDKTRKLRHRAYEFFADDPSIITIDATASIDAIHRQIVAFLPPPPR